MRRFLLSLFLIAAPAIAQADDAPVASAIPAVPAAAATLPRGFALPADLSPWGMFLAADPVVKSVLLLLVLASLATWTVWLAKSLELNAAKRRLASSIAGIAAAHGLRDAAAQLKDESPVAAMTREALDEREQSQDTDGTMLLDRIQSRLDGIESAARRKLQRGPVSWPRSARPRLSSAFSARCGAS